MQTETVDCATTMPSLSSSPWILVAPHSEFSKLILRIRSRNLLGDPRPAPRRAGFPSPVAGKTLAMPAHDSLRPDDAQGIKNARVATIEPDEQDAVDPTQMQSPARRSLLQDVELMPQYQDFGFQLQSRLE